MYTQKNLNTNLRNCRSSGSLLKCEEKSNLALIIK